MEAQNQTIINQLNNLFGRIFHGRRTISAAVDSITADNIVQVMQDAISIHESNVADTNYLYDYFKGIQPILARTKAIRPEINNKIVENHAYEAVSFKLSYEFSYPVQYVSRGKSDKADQVSNLERFMRSENKYTDDGEIAQWMYICGQGYRFCLPRENALDVPFRITSLDPRAAFVIYSADAFHDPLAGAVITEREGKKVYTIYTPDTVFEYVDGEITSKSITVGYVPIIEYPLNPERMGAFEPVIPLFNAINILDSNALDGVEQIIQAIVAVVGVEVQQEELDAVKNNGGILNIKGAPGGTPVSIQTIAQKVPQSELDQSKDRLYRMALTIMGIPDRAAQTSGGDTGEAVALRNGWSVAEARALMTERFWNASENRFLKLVLSICHTLTPDAIENLDIADIDTKFTRNLSENLLVKTQGLNNLKTAGINKEMAIQSVGLFSDPHAVAEASTDWDGSGDEGLSVSIAFKDLPTSGKIQAAKMVGIVLTPQDIEGAAAPVTPGENTPIGGIANGSQNAP